MNWRTLTLIASLFVMLCFLASCDKVQRYKILSFFFDEVPPPQGSESVVDQQQSSATPEHIQESDETQIVTYVHEPYQSCDPICHGERQKGFGGIEDVKIPETCYRCHEEKDYSITKETVHGPVAVGQCMQCHDPHKSEHEYILNKAVPELCFQCHEQSQIELIDGHQQESSDCLRCHFGHSSQSKKLLRQGWSVKNN